MTNSNPEKEKLPRPDERREQTDVAFREIAQREVAQREAKSQRLRQARLNVEIGLDQENAAEMNGSSAQ